jgi:hypothetical protein
VAAEAAAVKLRSGKFARRGRRSLPPGGHLFPTTWIPGVSVKSVRLGWWRLQWCPVGRHLSIVVPARTSDLSDDERRAAAATRDTRIS